MFTGTRFAYRQTFSFLESFYFPLNVGGKEAAKCFHLRETEENEEIDAPASCTFIDHKIEQFDNLKINGNTATLKKTCFLYFMMRWLSWSYQNGFISQFNLVCFQILLRVFLLLH